MPKIAIVDTAYPAFLANLPPLTGSYEVELAKYLALGFGTSDFYSHNLKARGWEARDLIGNYGNLQRRWLVEDRFRSNPPDHDVFDLGQEIALMQIEEFRPDVVFMQDLSFFNTSVLRTLGDKYVLAGQCSCPMPKNANIRQFELLCTSFPHYVDKFKAHGVERVEYLPLAFDPRMLKYASPVRDIDISFVGGVGRNSHWKAGTDILEAVAAKFGKRFWWFGYGLENLSRGSALRKCYRGEAWGRQMYEIYGRSKCVVNRHGEIAQGYTNNLRTFEVTGMGACLFTERDGHFIADDGLFPPEAVVQYFDATDLNFKIEYYLCRNNERAGIAAAGQAHALASHTYAQRMAKVSSVLMECLERRKVAQ